MTAVDARKSSLTPKIPANSYNLSSRRNDLELLRIIAVFILIFYHTAKLYANGDFHFKSAYQFENLSNWMSLLEPWRMSLLWLISGIALRHALHKYGAWISLKQRSARLLAPLLFGILVVIPPQLFIEMAGKGQLPDNLSYLDFYRAFWNLKDPLFDQHQSGILPHMDVNHLWYLRELWIFSLMIIIAYSVWKTLTTVFPKLDAFFIAKSQTKFLENWRGAMFSCLIILAMIVLKITLRAMELDQQEIARKLSGFLFLSAGYFLASASSFWNHVFANRQKYLVAAAIAFPIFFYVYHFLYSKSEEKDAALLLIASVSIRVYAAAIVFAALGYAKQFGDQFQTFSKRWSQAVLPVYILHQTFILIAAYLLKPYAVGAWLEPILVLGFTLIALYLAIIVIEKSNALGLCFGLKWQSRAARENAAGESVPSSPWGSRLRQALGYVLLLPLALKLIV